MHSRKSHQTYKRTNGRVHRAIDGRDTKPPAPSFSPSRYSSLFRATHAYSYKTITFNNNLCAPWFVFLLFTFYVFSFPIIMLSNNEKHNIYIYRIEPCQSVTTGGLSFSSCCVQVANHLQSYLSCTHCY